MSMTFYTNPNSRGRMVRWMLEEIGQPYDTVIMDYEPASRFDRWGGSALARPPSSDLERVRFFDMLNPIGKIPVLVHDGHTISESGAIIAYLAETFPETGLSPMPDERADYHRWMFFAAGPLEQAVTNNRAGVEPLPEQEFFFGHGSYGRTIDQLEWAVSRHPFIAGDRFTAADIYVGSHIGWGLGLQTVPPRPAFLDYTSRLVTREAYGRGVAKDDALVSRTATPSG